jgi:hypothetical protein
MSITFAPEHLALLSEELRGQVLHAQNEVIAAVCRGSEPQPKIDLTAVAATAVKIFEGSSEAIAELRDGIHSALIGNPILQTWSLGSDAATPAASASVPAPATLSQVDLDRRRAGIPLKKKARQNDRLPLNLAGTTIYNSACGVRWDGRMIIRGGKIAYKFHDKIYDSPTAVSVAHGKSRGTQGASGWAWIRFGEGPYKGKTLAQYYDAELA